MSTTEAIEKKEYTTAELEQMLAKRKKAEKLAAQKR